MKRKFRDFEIAYLLISMHILLLEFRLFLEIGLDGEKVNKREKKYIL